MDTNKHIRMTEKIETLEEIKNYDFSSYDSSKIKDTKTNISGLLEGTDKIFNEWKLRKKCNEDSIDMELDFDFYSADKVGSESFCYVLEKNGFKTKIKTTRTMLFFKGYEIRVSKKQYWTLKTVEYEIERLGLISRKYNLLIEGYGSAIN